MPLGKNPNVPTNRPPVRSINGLTRRAGYLSSGPETRTIKGAAHAPCSGTSGSAHGECWQGIQRTRHVEQAGVGVDVHGEVQG
jgi:hypothetical protein